MDTTTSTTLTGSKMWIVIGIIVVVIILIVIGIFIPETRTYITASVEKLLGLIPVVNGLH